MAGHHRCRCAERAGPCVAGAHRPHPRARRTLYHPAAAAHWRSRHPRCPCGRTPQEDGGGMELKPGYKQTEVGAILEEWEIKKLGEIAAYANGKAHEKNIKDYGRYIVVNSKFISSEGETKKYSDDCFCPTSTGEVLMVMS